MNDEINEETKFDYLKSQVFNSISSISSKCKPISTKELCERFNLTTRDLKKIISELRNDYPIVSKETDGGGYWIAESEIDIIDFIKMIERREKSYEETIKIMNNHLLKYGNIPSID